MTIERDPEIRFHEEGTLNAVTRWVGTHEEGVPEWLKNTRRAYQSDRANVHEEHRSAVLLLKDQDEFGPARIGFLDVGGATLEDVTAWSTWQDPEASSRSSATAEEETQGNGGKAYMYRLFGDTSRIFGVRDGVRNCKGFEGPAGSVDRGTPGFIPDIPGGREVPVGSVDSELAEALGPYGLAAEDLPDEVRAAIRARQAFTLVEGVDPLNLYRGRIDAEDLLPRVIRHDQSTLAIEQLRIYAFHNGRALNEGKSLQLQPIDPYAGVEGPFVHPIPTDLPLPTGELVSTTEGGKRPTGRLVLQTSREHMPNAYKRLKPRWKMSYRTQYQMIGAKPISDLAPATPGAAFIFGSVELPALEPGYVEHGRRRPKDGPLIEALDLFMGEKIRELSKIISDRRKQDLDDRALDEVQEENRKLDDFKNRFLSPDGGGDGASGGTGDGPEPPQPPPPREYGEVPDSILLSLPEDGLRVGLGVTLRLKQLLHVRVVDAAGRTVPNVDLQWFSSDSYVARFSEEDALETRDTGKADVWVTVKGTPIETTHIPIEVWRVDHVLLTPRELEVPIGKRKRVIAEVTADDGRRSTDVYLKWRHDADDQFIVRVSPSGWVTGNRIGRTGITAGAKDVWARIPTEVQVIPNPEEPEQGGGFPRLLLTGRDVDPATNEIRPGDPDAPALWQDPSDFVHNVWWLNLQSPEAAYCFRNRAEDPVLWRTFHAGKVIEMVVQVHMQEEFTQAGDLERPEFWAIHHAAHDRHQVRTTQQMWEELEPYVKEGEGLE